MIESVSSASMDQMVTAMTINSRFRSSPDTYRNIMGLFCVTLDRLGVTSTDDGAYNFLDDLTAMDNLLRKFEKIGVTKVHGQI